MGRAQLMLHEQTKLLFIQYNTVQGCDTIFHDIHHPAIINANSLSRIQWPCVYCGITYIRAV